MRSRGPAQPDPVKRRRRLSSLFLAGAVVLAGTVSSSTNARAVQIDARLAPLRPLLGKTWQGTLTSPDGARSSLVVRTFELVEKGRVVRLTKTNRDRGGKGEGFIYWDDVGRTVRLFFIEDGGVLLEGTVTSEGKVITFAGTMTWPEPPKDPSAKQSYEFRNTFEVLSDAAMRDTWYQNAFGTWKRGHVIEFEATTGGSTSFADSAPVDIGFATTPASGTDREKTLGSVVRIRDISEQYATGGLYLITQVGDRGALFERENSELLRHHWIEQPWRFCTIFSSANSGSPITGRNWDNQNVGSVIVSRYQPPGGYASISFARAIDLGFAINLRIDEMAATPFGERLLLAPFYAYDGINEKGFFAAVTGVRQVEVRPGEGKEQIFIGYLVRRLLDSCKSVDEALEFVEDYVPFDLDERSLNCHFFIADAAGRSAVLEYVDGSWKKVTGEKGWQVLTNKPVFGTPDATLRARCGRYRTASEALETCDGRLDWPAAMQLLKDTSQSGTTWSVVYLPKSEEVLFSVYQDWDRIYRLGFPEK